MRSKSLEVFALLLGLMFVAIVANPQGLLVISPGSGLSISSCPLELVYPIRLPNFIYNITNSTTGGALEISGQVVNTNTLNTSRLVASVALFDFSWRSVTLTDEIVRLRQFNVSAAILTTSVESPGKAEWILTERYMNDPNFRRLVNFPIFQVSIKSCGPLVDLILPDYNDPINSWNVLADSAGSYVGQVFVGLCNLGIICFALYKLGMFGKFVGLIPVQMVYVVLVFEIIASIFRICFAIDPSGLRKLYDPFFSLFFINPSIPVSINLVGALMIQFYWNKALKSFGSRSIGWLLKYLYILSAVMIAFGIVAAVIFALELPFITILIVIAVQIVYAVFFIGIFSYTVYTAHSLFKFLRETSQLTTKQKTSQQKAVRMSKILIVSCCFDIIAIFLTSQGTLLFLTTEISYYVLMILQFTMSGVISFLNVFVIQEPTTYPKASGSSKTRSSRHSSVATTSTGRSRRSSSITRSSVINQEASRAPPVEDQMEIPEVTSPISSTTKSESEFEPESDKSADRHDDSKDINVSVDAEIKSTDVSSDEVKSSS